MIFVPQLPNEAVEVICKAHHFRIPKNVMAGDITRWHHGWYYIYGGPKTWIPLTKFGGIGTHAFHEHTVKFPAPVEAHLLRLLDEKRRLDRNAERHLTSKTEDSTNPNRGNQ